MQTIIKNLVGAAVFGACLTYVVFAVAVLPATQNPFIAATSGQAFAVAVGYLIFMIYTHGPTLHRLSAKLRRVSRRKVQLLIAETILWLVALSALAFSCVGCSDLDAIQDERDDLDYWTEGQTIHKGDTVIYIDYRRADNLTRIMTIHAGKVIDWQYTPLMSE